MLESFAQSVLNGTKMIADGIEGLNSLSISNAAYLSSWTDSWAEIPTDEALFEKYLKEQCQNENIKRKADGSASGEDFSQRWKVRW